MKKELLYPILIECCQYTNDKYWKGIFEDMAYGQTPYGTFIVKDHLTCNFKEKEFSYLVSQIKPAETLFHDIYNLLHDKMGLLSREQLLVKKASAVINSTDLLKKDWASIKKKSIKDLLIEKFVIQKQKEYNLSLKKTRDLFSSIFVAFVFKLITATDIKYEDGEIKSIDGIEFRDGHVEFRRSVNDIEVNLIPELVLDKKYMIDNWTKYLKANYGCE